MKAGLSIVGRDTSCDVRVPLPEISRRHCQIVVDDEGLTIRDLGSSNGTFVNYEPITEETRVHAGDVVSLGPLTFVARIDGVPGTIDPAVVQRRVQESAGRLGEIGDPDDSSFFDFDLEDDAPGDDDDDEQPPL